MPSVEMRVVFVLLGSNWMLVEYFMVRVSELDVLESLEGLDEAMANNLDLGLVRNSL